MHQSQHASGLMECLSTSVDLVELRVTVTRVEGKAWYTIILACTKSILDFAQNRIHDTSKFSKSKCNGIISPLIGKSLPSKHKPPTKETEKQILQVFKMSTTN